MKARIRLFHPEPILVPDPSIQALPHSHGPTGLSKVWGRKSPGRLPPDHPLASNHPSVKQDACHCGTLCKILQTPRHNGAPHKVIARCGKGLSPQPDRSTVLLARHPGITSPHHSHPSRADESRRGGRLFRAQVGMPAHKARNGGARSAPGMGPAEHGRAEPPREKGNLLYFSLP